jgi:hypothetical protein
MNQEQIIVGKCNGYSVYASVNPVTKRLYDFTIAGTNNIFANYLLVEKYLQDKKN